MVMLPLDHDQHHDDDDFHVDCDDDRCVQGWYPVSPEKRRVAGFARQVCRHPFRDRFFLFATDCLFNTRQSSEGA